jgi:hypothetical protein
VRGLPISGKFIRQFPPVAIIDIFDWFKLADRLAETGGWVQSAERG